MNRLLSNVADRRTDEKETNAAENITSFAKGGGGWGIHMVSSQQLSAYILVYPEMMKTDGIPEDNGRKTS